MGKISIKALLGRNRALKNWLEDWSQENQAPLNITNNLGNSVYSTMDGSDQSFEFPLSVEDLSIGTVFSTKEKAHEVASFLNILLEKESEKRKLGSEVLHLYQELNIIYGFAESLGEAISTNAIAEIALTHTTNSIPSDAGAVVLWDEDQQMLTVPSISGETLFNVDQIIQHAQLLLKIGLDGQSAIITDLSEIKEHGLVESNVTSLVYGTLKGKDRILGAIILLGTQENQFTAAHLKLLVTLSLQSSSALESALLFEKNLSEIKKREETMQRINEVIKKFVPNEFISSLGKENITDIRLGDQVEKIVTVLFTDIRDFTTLSEKMSPEENFRFVSSFNEILGPIIRANNGFINQYLGDSIMAIFPDKPEDALRAAIEMQNAVRILNLRRAEQGMPTIQAGIGMHTGPLIMGITGDENRLDAATISDTVNTASRIESLTKYYKSSLLLSENTIDNIPNQEQFSLRKLGKVQLKGKNNALSVLECVDGLEANVNHARKANLEIFDKAIETYQLGDFSNALDLFDEVLSNDPTDETVRVFIENSKKYLAEGTPENWNGAEKMYSK